MSKVSDLRTFLEELEENGELVEVAKEVSLTHEIGSVIATLEKKQGPAVKFSNVGTGSIPVVAGLLSSHKKIALALETSPEGVVDTLENILDNPVSPKEIAAEKAPCRENVYTGDQVDLTSIPIPIHAPHDGGPYITAGVTVSKELDGPRQNLSFQRLQIKGKNRMGIMINEWRHMRGFLSEAEKRGVPLPFSVVIGVDPVIMIAAGFRYDGDEMELASAMRKQVIEVVKGVTNDILVPAHAEYVIEGVVKPGEREEEGPLAEFTGHYGELWQSPVVEVTAITHRNDPIWQTLNGGSFEHINLGNVLPREPLLRRHVKYVSSNVLDVHIPPYGSGFLAVIRIRKDNEGEPKNIAMAAMTTYVNIKNVIIVDEDVDIYSASDIMWAVSNRVDPERDVFVVKNSQGHELDPCSDEHGVQNKTGIDATLWKEKKGLRRVEYPDVDLSEYLNTYKRFIGANE